MKKILLSLITICSGIVLAGCGDNTSQDKLPDTYYQANLNVEVKLSLNSKKTSYELPFTYNDRYFFNDSKVYDKGLSELSYGNSLAAATTSITTKFFNECKFKDITPVGYDVTPTADTCAYTLAHKELGSYQVIAMSARWHDYQKEWANNFTIGKTGDHEGFAARAGEMNTALQEYIATHNNGQKIKLWFTGYSRGGGIINVLACRVLREKKIAVEQSNMFVYTFEAPRGLSKAEGNAATYKNIHNVINNGDLISHFAPEEYGLYRCGIDYDIYNKNASSLIKAFDNEIDITEFVEYKTGEKDEKGQDIIIKDDAEMVDYIFSKVFHVNSSDTTIIINTREQYVDNLQPYIAYCLGLVFSLTNSTQNEIITELSNKEMIDLMILIASGKSMADFFKPYLEKDNVQFDETELANNLEKTRNVVLAVASPLLAMLMDDAKTNLTRTLNLHYPDMTYVLLKDYHK